MSPRLRFQILARDNFTCRYCGRKAPSVELHVDHVHPQALGGTHDESNLVSACSECNQGKRAQVIKPPSSALFSNTLWVFHEENELRQHWEQAFPSEQKHAWKGREVREFLFRMGPDQVRFEVFHATGIAKTLEQGSSHAWTVFRSRCTSAVRARKQEEERATDQGYWLAWQSHPLTPKEAHND